MTDTMKPQEWHHQANGQNYMISTHRQMLDDNFIHASFATDEMYWATPMPQTSLAVIKETSLFFGLYVAGQDTLPATTNPTKTWKQVGMARLVTDYMSIAFLTDVYVMPDHQGGGLGKWLIQCVGEWSQSMPELRRVMLMVKNAPHAIRFYEQLLNASVFDQVSQNICFMSSKSLGVDSS